LDKTLNKELRIIAGKFRGRKIIFSDQNVKLRPTMDRVRETLFNWLAPYIVGADCLDLFAGSGVFSFEAISRGANFSLAVEYNYDTYQNIIQNCQKLEIEQQIFNIIHQDVLLFLNNNLQYRKFNIIFLDPPYTYDQNILLSSLKLLVDNHFLQKNSKIYFETDKDLQEFKDSLYILGLQLKKISKAGKVYFYLYEYL
jgi:16S rRNA (guanine966-N2)-methyltransferase